VTLSAPNSVQPLAHPRVELASGVDALYLSAQGTGTATLFADLEVARAAAEAVGLPVDWILGGQPVRVQPSAWGKYRYCAQHELARLGFTPSRQFPIVRVQPTAVALHSIGPAATVRWAEDFLDACCIEATLHVSRLDLHSDWQGLDVRADERQNFVTYSEHRALYEVAEEMSGVTFGKRGGKLMARLYDKTREAKDKGHDWWPEVWGAKFDAERPVLRVEFEFTRAGLKEFEVDRPEDALRRAPELWAYATCEWLSLRVPTSDQTRSRWPVDERWQLVQGSALRGNCAPAARIKAGEREGQLRVFRKLATGVLSSMAVPLGTDDVADTLDAVEQELYLYEKISGRTFPDRVGEKRQRQ
jgi:hypothetical protein